MSKAELITFRVKRGAYATDICHIERMGMGGSKHKDVPENLMALCRALSGN